MRKVRPKLKRIPHFHLYPDNPKNGYENWVGIECLRSNQHKVAFALDWNAFRPKSRILPISDEFP